MTSEIIKNKPSLPLGQLAGIWLGSGMAVVVFLLIYIEGVGLPLVDISHNEVVRLIQGGTLVLAALWAVSLLGFNIRAFHEEFSARSKETIRLTAKYFLIYLLTAAVFISMLSLAAMLLMKLGAFTMDSFNDYYVKATAERLAQKNYLRDILLGSPIKFLVYLFSTCVLIPAEEEVFTRRLLYVSLRHKLGFASSLVITSLVFGIEHLGAAALPAFVFGMFLGWIYEKHQNLIVNILVHGLINLSVTMTMIYYSM